MSDFAFSVEKDRAAQHLAHTRWTGAMVNHEFVLPALMTIAKRLTESLRAEFSEGGGIYYQGGMQGGFEFSPIGEKEVVITQSAPYEKFIRTGTKGPYKSPPPPRVLEWARSKFPEDVAKRVYGSIYKTGTSDWFANKHPGGERRFDYPEWVVEHKEKDTLDEMADKLGISFTVWAIGHGQMSFGG